MKNFFNKSKLTREELTKLEEECKESNKVLLHIVDSKNTTWVKPSEKTVELVNVGGVNYAPSLSNHTIDVLEGNFLVEVGKDFCKIDCSDIISQYMYSTVWRSNAKEIDLSFLGYVVRFLETLKTYGKLYNVDFLLTDIDEHFYMSLFALNLVNEIENEKVYLVKK